MSSLSDFKLNLTANIKQRVNIDGSHYHVIRSPATLYLSFDDGKEIERDAGQGGSYTYKYVDIYAKQNLEATLALGHGDYFESTAYAFTGLTAPNNHVEHPDMALVANTVTKVADSNENRFNIYLFSPNTNTDPIRVYYSNPVNSSSGGVIYPGGNAELRTRTEVWVKSMNSDQNIYILESQNV